MSKAITLWEENFSMAKLSSWRVGGRVRWLYSPQCKDDLIHLTQVKDAGKEPPLFVGYGSNLLVRNGGYDGIAVHTVAGFKTLRIEEDNRVYAEVGVGCPKLARFCAQQGMAEAEFFVGIPGTIGGALAMNAGCHGSETWDFVDAVYVIYNGQFKICKKEEFSFSYRHVKKADNMFFLGAWFLFPPGKITLLQQKLKALLRERSLNQPIGFATTGSVFCNPPGDYAGRLIEFCGLKNMRIGNAEVSEKHANFIINRGNATASDIESLIYLVQQRVKEKTGITLCLEVRIVGEMI